MNFFKAFPNEKRLPGLQRLYGGRWAMTRLLTLDSTEVDGDVLASNGTGFAFEASAAELLQMTAAGVTPADFHLIDLTTGGDGEEVAVLYKYETLTSTLVDEVAPVIDYDLNGLRRYTRKLIALPGTSVANFLVRVSTYESESIIAAGAFIVGRRYRIVAVGSTDFTAIGASANTVGVVFTATGVGGGTGTARYPTLYLGNLRDESTDAAARVTLVYLEPGVIKKGEGAGPVQGTKSHTWRTWMLDATSGVEMTGYGGVIPGVVTEKDDDNVAGFPVRLFSSVAATGGSITGVKQTYKDVVDVDVPGTVELTTQAVTIGGESGTIAIAKVTPRRTKSIAASVTMEISTTVPDTGTVAYDIGAISCSVTSTQAANNYRGYDVMSTISGGQTYSAPRRSINIGAGIQPYPGCYLSAGAGPVTGTFSYTAGTQFERSSGGSIVTPIAQTSNETNTLIGTGSTAADGYDTTAGSILRRKPRLVFTALDGTAYYEVLTWKVA